MRDKSSNEGGKWTEEQKNAFFGDTSVKVAHKHGLLKLHREVWLQSTVYGELTHCRAHSDGETLSLTDDDGTEMNLPLTDIRLFYVGAALCAYYEFPEVA